MCASRLNILVKLRVSVKTVIACTCILFGVWLEHTTTADTGQNSGASRGATVGTGVTALIAIALGMTALSDFL